MDAIEELAVAVEPKSLHVKQGLAFMDAMRKASASAAGEPRTTASQRLQHTKPWLLLREMNHRLCNDYGAAVSFVSLAGARAKSEDTKAALSALAERLHALCLLHRALQIPATSDPIDISPYLRAICHAQALARFQDGRVRLTFDGPSIPMNPEHCWYLGLCVAELVTNAAKHAFIAGTGEIRVTLERAGSHAICRVIDNGVSEHFAPTGLGSQIIAELMVHMSGSIRRDFGPDGCAVTLVFPV